MAFLDILQALNRARVRYLVVGGVAVALHGVERQARDLDVYPALDPDNLLRAIGTLVNLGYHPMLPVAADEIATPEVRWRWIRKRNLRVFTMMNPRDPVHPVDLMVVERVPFEEAWSRRDRRRVRGVQVPVMSLGDLIRLKRMSGRERDRLDIESLKRVRSS
jgi:hypothetical protein